VDMARLSRNVAGAAARNQSLYKSTDADTSAFHRCGLSELIGIALTIMPRLRRVVHIACASTSLQNLGTEAFKLAITNSVLGDAGCLVVQFVQDQLQVEVVLID